MCRLGPGGLVTLSIGKAPGTPIVYPCEARGGAWVIGNCNYGIILLKIRIGNIIMDSSEKIKALYRKYKLECDRLFGKDFLKESDNSQRKYYVYAWYTVTKPPMYFYVGKGTGNRWRHIKKDVRQSEKAKKKNERLNRLSLINKKYKTSCKILLSDLTENEALIGEECIKREFSSSGEVLIDEENWYLNDEQILAQDSDSPIVKSDFWERYIEQENLYFDKVAKEVFSGKIVFYPFFINKTIEQENAERRIANYIISHGGKIQKSISRNHLKNKAIFVWPGQLREETYVIMRESGANIYNFREVLDYIKAQNNFDTTDTDHNLDLRVTSKDQLFLKKQQEMKDYIRNRLVEAGADKFDIEESKYHDEISLHIKNHGFVSFLCYKKKPGGNITVPLDDAEGVRDLLVNINSWKGDFIFESLDELEKLKPFFEKQVTKTL